MTQTDTFPYCSWHGVDLGTKAWKYVVTFFFPFSTDRCSFLERVNTIGFLSCLWHSKVPWRAARISVSERPCWNYSCNLLISVSPVRSDIRTSPGQTLAAALLPWVSGYLAYPLASNKLLLKCVKMHCLANEQSLGTRSCHQLLTGKPFPYGKLFAPQDLQKASHSCVGVRWAQGF